MALASRAQLTSRSACCARLGAAPLACPAFAAWLIYSTSGSRLRLSRHSAGAAPICGSRPQRFVTGAPASFRFSSAPVFTTPGHCRAHVSKGHPKERRDSGDWTTRLPGRCGFCRAGSSTTVVFAEVTGWTHLLPVLHGLPSLHWGQDIQHVYVSVVQETNYQSTNRIKSNQIKGAPLGRNSISVAVL